MELSNVWSFRHWFRFAYDHIIMCDHVTNNMTEAFNNMLGTHRFATYLELLDFIRKMVIRKFNERNEECGAWNFVIPPRVNAKVLKNNRGSRLLTIIAVGDLKYKILGLDRGYDVKLRQYTCGCGSWQIIGIPYSHAMATISQSCDRDTMKDMVADFVHQSLPKSSYLQTY
ncbi:hypothetical protein Dsin_016554 [Dipteronia sinensis]|uniref:Zinc finger PMZ-type domain-containing protein n=1 Tax=Dipteronia sinensis TaxID=43782 RepID=A0AAE0AE34_9ROSI|nr:hypothetical protein Dsin_016554 [Dipteronia sinensis]